MYFLAPSQMLFVMMFLSSFIFVLNCDDWFLIWFGLEINMFSFILLMYCRMDMLSIEVCMKYFFVQTIGSAGLLLIFYFNSFLMNEISTLFLSYKMGGGPFYYWFPSVCQGMRWGSLFIMISLQKIIPFWLIMSLYSMLLWIIIILSLVIGVMGSFNQINLKRLIAYSSIHHMGWMGIFVYMDSLKWFIYLFIYSLVMLGMVEVLGNNKVETIWQVTGGGKGNIKWSFFLLVMSMAGIPPLLGFFLKWFGLLNIMFFDFSLMLIMILFSVIMLYIYIRLVVDIMMSMKVEFGWGLHNMKMYFGFSSDFFSIGGIILGIFFGIFLMY